jgi:hypothetical protein
LSLTCPSWGCFHPIKIVSFCRGLPFKWVCLQLLISVTILRITWVGLLGRRKPSSKILLFLHIHKYQHVTIKIVCQSLLCAPDIHFFITNFFKYLWMYKSDFTSFNVTFLCLYFKNYIIIKKIEIIENWEDFNSEETLLLENILWIGECESLNCSL